jgi:hypothetical protein
MENLKKKYEEYYRKKLMLMEEEQKRILKTQENKFRKEIEEFKKKNYRPENLVLRTPSAKYFTIDGNTITKSSGNSYKLVLLDVVAGEMFFSFRTRILNKKGRLFIGVTDRATQKERDCAEREHSIRYGCSGGMFNIQCDW